MQNNKKDTTADIDSVCEPRYVYAHIPNAPSEFIVMLYEMALDNTIGEMRISRGKTNADGIFVPSGDVGTWLERSSTKFEAYMSDELGAAIITSPTLGALAEDVAKHLGWLNSAEDEK